MFKPVGYLEPDGFFTVAVSFQCPLAGLGPQERIHRFAGRDFEIGEVVGKLVHREIDTRGDLRRDMDRLGVIVEQVEHLAFVFQVTLAVLREQLARFVDGAVVFYAGENVEQLAVVLVGIIDAVRGEIGNVAACRRGREAAG